METETKPITIDKKVKKFITKVLRDMVIELTFTKKNGTERVMNCTLKEDLLPVTEAKEETKERKTNDDVLAVYDVDVEGWRSFRWDSLTQIKVKLV
jgi:WYL_2, Sm-like SH3 beta-barrel fold